jgi:hypothetical protein
MAERRREEEEEGVEEDERDEEQVGGGEGRAEKAGAPGVLLGRRDPRRKLDEARDSTRENM